MVGLTVWTLLAAVAGLNARPPKPGNRLWLLRPPGFPDGLGRDGLVASRVRGAEGQGVLLPVGARGRPGPGAEGGGTREGPTSNGHGPAPPWAPERGPTR